mgnify:CR=1 FL=1
MMTIGLIALDLDGTCWTATKNLSGAQPQALERCARMAYRLYRPQAGQWMVSRRKYVSAGSQLCHIHQRRNSSGPC